MTSDEVHSEITRLRSELAAAIEENVRLKEKLTSLETHERRPISIRGEQLIHLLVGGQLTTENQCYDICAGTPPVHLEVKTASPQPATKGKPTMRWHWGKVFGQSRKKVHDRLILIGESDGQHQIRYKDPNVPYVLFDVPFEDVWALSTTGGTAERSIRLTTNPERVRSGSASSPLFSKYQVDGEELKRRYRS